MHRTFYAVTPPASLRVLSPRPRLLGTGDGGSLQNVNTTILPDGAVCVVLENQTLYLFVRGGDPEGVTPGSGPGAWVALASVS
jgi:hypothetical protein